jgi:hypothetical protein
MRVGASPAHFGRQRAPGGNVDEEQAETSSDSSVNLTETGTFAIGILINQMRKSNCVRRRAFISAVSGCLAATAGCLDQQPGSGEGSATERGTAAPCKRAFTTLSRDVSGCGGTKFENVSTTPKSTAETSAGGTPYEGTFNDFLQVSILSESSDPVELRGCVRGTDENEQKSVGVTRTLDGSENRYNVEIGPFTHPGGVEKYHLWIVGCEAEVRGAT